jgi:hypothetical protein
LRARACALLAVEVDFDALAARLEPDFPHGRHPVQRPRTRSRAGRALASVKQRDQITEHLARSPYIGSLTSCTGRFFIGWSISI